MNASERYGSDKPIKAEIVFAEDRCMHRKSVFAQCGPCVDACPSHAIHWVSDRDAPAFDAALCLHCGTCLSSCPFEAFQATNFSERKMLKRMAGTNPVRVRCWLPRGELSALHSPIDGYQAAVCLAALTPAALFSMARDRPCVMATASCEGCALYATVGPVLRGNMRCAQALLGDWHRQGNLVDEGGVAFPAAPLPDYGASGDEPVRSAARALFSRWTTAAHKEEVSVDDLRSVKRHRIEWRSMLERLWKESTADQTDGGSYLWPIHHVDEQRCASCGTCVSMCPTGAIVLEDEGDGVTYRFNVGRCSECGLCVRSCPQEAIVRSQGPCDRPFQFRPCYKREDTAACDE